MKKINNTEVIKIHVLHCGQVQVDIAVPFKQRTLNPLAFTGLFRSSKQQIILPVSAYLIEHPKGLILVDTGWHTDVRSNQSAYLGKIAYQTSKAFLPPDKAVHEQLNHMGLCTTDLDYVVISHMDADHASGIKLVKDAKHILTSNLEWQATKKSKLRYQSHMWESVNVETFAFSNSSYGPMGASFDLFGDESVVFVHTPGHSHGMVSVLVQNNERFVLLANDTGYSQKSWDDLILPGITVNKKQAMDSLRWVKKMSMKTNCLVTLANHDLDIKPDVIEL